MHPPPLLQAQHVAGELLSEFRHRPRQNWLFCDSRLPVLDFRRSSLENLNPEPLGFCLDKGVAVG
jgi:hypothetical protein